MLQIHGHSTVSSAITVTVWLCACTGLLVQHYSNCVTLCMYRTAVQHYSNCVTVHVQNCWYSITVTVWLCECTGLLVQHYSNCVTVHVQDCWYSITVTVCMYRLAGTTFIDCDYNKQRSYTVCCWCWPNVYIHICNIMSIHNSAYCYTQCDIKTTNLSYT